MTMEKKMSKNSLEVFNTIGDLWSAQEKSFNPTTTIFNFNFNVIVRIVRSGCVICEY
jgi:hypothetical protein